MKNLGTLGEKERTVVEERRRHGYRVEHLRQFGDDLEPHLRALVGRLLPDVGHEIDLAGFVDTHADHPMGRGDRAPGVPPPGELVRQGLETMARSRFAELQVDEQDALIGRMRRGEADDGLSFPARAFVDRLLVTVLAGYLAHPATWERIGFNGPAYPEGYAWISAGAVSKRHENAAGAGRL